jgi:hypothetical protein
MSLCIFANGNWSGMKVLDLAVDYSGSGNLADLKNRFTLGNFIWPDGSTHIQAPTGYVIDNTGTPQLGP